MKLTTADLQRLAEVATVAAVEAGQLIAASRPRHVAHKPDGQSLASQVVTDIDRRSEDLIVDRLAPTLDRFELALLTEERHDDGGRLTADHFWCVDPLDGTLPFIEGSAGYAVSIALVDRSGTPLIGAIHDPVDSMLLHAVRGVGAYRNHQPWPTAAPSLTDQLRVFADRSFLARDDHEAVEAGLEQIAHDLGLAGVEIQVPRGAVMNACGALETGSGCYIKFPAATGGGSLWDFAATACLFDEVGAVATDVEGRPLDLNRAASTSMNHRGVLFATNEMLASRIRSFASESGLAR